MVTEYHLCKNDDDVVDVVVCSKRFLPKFQPTITLAFFVALNHALL